MSGTVHVQSELSIAMEVGLVRGADPEHKSCLAPGPNYRRVQVHHGLNTVDASLAREWFKTNRKFLECIKDGRIKIVDSVSTSQEVAAA